MGKSFGAAVATYISTEIKSKEGLPASQVFKGLILESAFTSVEELVKHKTKGWIPKTFFSDNKWPTIERISNVRTPTLIIHG